MTKEKLYKILNYILVVGMILGGFGLGTYYYQAHIYDRLFSAFSIIITLELPQIFNKTKLKFSSQDKLIYNIFILVSHFLGCIVNLYKLISWYDLFAHCLSGVLTFYLAYIILKRTNHYKVENKAVNFLFCMGLVALVAVSWEIIEFTCDTFLSTNLQHNVETGVIDTMGDLMVAYIGGLLAYIFYFSYLKCKKKEEHKLLY